MNKTLLKNTCMLYFMNIAKMVFPLITLPYLTRVLSVECFGVVAFVKAIMQYMQIIVDFGFMLSGTKDIALACDDRRTISNEVSSILLAKFIISFLAFMVLLFSFSFIKMLNDNKMFVLLSFLPVFLSNFLIDFYFRGIEKMEFITIRFVAMKGIAALFTVLFIKSDQDLFLVPIFDIIGTFVAIWLVYIFIKNNNIEIAFPKIDLVLHKIKESSIYFFSSISGISLSVFTTLIVGGVLGSVDVAYWSVCMQIVAATHSMYNPLTDAVYPYMVKNRDISLIRKSLEFYMPIIVFGCIVVYYMAEYILLIIGGRAYTAAAMVLRMLIPVMLFGFPSMLFGWPCLGAINKGYLVTCTTSYIAVLQIVILILLVFINELNLIVVSVLRSAIEFLLFASRMFFVYKNKMNFMKWD